MEEISVPEPPQIPDGWVAAELDWVGEALVVDVGHNTIQTRIRKQHAGMLQQRNRAHGTQRTVQPLTEPWLDQLIETVRDTWTSSVPFDPDEPRTAAALAEQVEALQIITSRKATVLVGRAGTGKTTVLGALSRAPSLGRIGAVPRTNRESSRQA